MQFFKPEAHAWYAHDPKPRPLLVELSHSQCVNFELEYGSKRYQVSLSRHAKPFKMFNSEHLVSKLKQSEVWTIRLKQSEVWTITPLIPSSAHHHPFSTVPFSYIHSIRTPVLLRWTEWEPFKSRNRKMPNANIVSRKQQSAVWSIWQTHGFQKFLKVLWSWYYCLPISTSC